ncbi:MAG: hydrolase family protein [Tardiphaga sp.]|nr:hydrolase family protein [Tardiphaga sp.]
MAPLLQTIAIFALLALAAPPAGAEDWVGTYGTSAAMPGPRFVASDYTVRVQGTLRYRLQVSIGGRGVQIRLSNEEGATPLRVAEVTVGLAADGLALRPGSVRQVTFGGAREVTMAPGAPALSDPVALTVPDLGDVIVSLYLPAAATVARNAVATPMAMVAARDVTGDLDFPAGAVDPHARPIVSAIAVRGTAGSIVTLGDSITDGARAKLPGTRGWPALLAQRLAARGTKMGVVNAGIAANRLLRDDFGTSGLARLDRDVFATPGLSHLIVLEGINDLQVSGLEQGGVAHPPVTAADLIAGYQEIIRRAHQRNVRVIGGTITPFQGSRNFSDAREQTRLIVNDWIRTGGAFDGVIDFERAVRDPARPQQIRAEFDSDDHLHPNDAGYEAMAAVIDLRLFDAVRAKRSGAAVK